MSKLNSEFQDQLLKRLYQDRDSAEYVNLTEEFDTIDFQLLYREVATLQESRLIDFYTAPEAYAVFNEPDFIKGKIRREGIQFYEDNYSFLKKHTVPIKIVVGALALLIIGYAIDVAIIQNKYFFRGESLAQQPDSTITGDSLAAKPIGDEIATPVESQPPAAKDVVNSTKLIVQTSEQQKPDTSKIEIQRQAGITPETSNQPGIAGIDRNDYTIEVDTLNHVIKVSPKVGQWDSTVLAIPVNEMEFVKPEFHSQRTLVSAAGNFIFDALGQQFSGLLSTDTPASNELYYVFHYTNKPTLLLFGSYPHNLHPHYFK